MSALVLADPAGHAPRPIAGAGVVAPGEAVEGRLLQALRGLRPRLGRSELVLRLATGQTARHVAALFGRTLEEVESRAGHFRVRTMVDALLHLLMLPATSVLGRLAGVAATYLGLQLQDGDRLAWHWCRMAWARGLDPALVLAAWAARRVARARAIPAGLPGPKPVRRRGLPGGPSAWCPSEPVWATGDPRMDRAALRWAREVCEGVLLAAGSAVRRERMPAFDAGPEEVAAIDAAIARVGADYQPRCHPPADLAPPPGDPDADEDARGFPNARSARERTARERRRDAPYPRGPG
jgi:hypothetical protein